MKSIVYFASLLIASTGAAYASEEPTVVTGSPYVEHVTYTQSDLTTDKGVKDLRSRVRHAAHHVCATDDNAFHATNGEWSCYNPTLKDAFAQVDEAVARARSGNLASASGISMKTR
jgi:UrcA family protein